jgi:hypothetical protein
MGEGHGAGTTEQVDLAEHYLEYFAKIIYEYLN